MPRVRGLPEFGDHRVNVADIDAWVENETELFAIPAPEPSPEDLAIAGHVSALIEDGATLQFGIGAVPDEVARLLATGSRGNFNIHTEMVCDGIMHLHRAGKVVNRKPVYDGVTVATFALGSAELYTWLDDNPDVRMLPVSATNEPATVKRMNRMVSVNAALAIDLAGQVTADHIGGRQYSGVGGHESFVTGAGEAPGGKSFVCLRSTATVGGRRVSKIVAELPAGSTVTTPRHHLQYVVTEYGAVDVSLLGDAARARALIDVAHPDFRDVLAAR
jgi:acyl-CoA hydrolase